MAILRRLELYNFAQHEDRVLDFGPGLTMFTGSMGSGKTNALMAPLSILINDWSLYPHTKQNMIYRGSAPKSHSYGAGTWQLVDGTLLRVVRGFRGVKSSLEINGKKVDERLSEADITAKVCELMHIDPDQVIKHHMVLQSQTSAIVESRDTNRIKFMAQLLGCEHLLEMQDEAGEALKKASAGNFDSLMLELRGLIRTRRQLRQSTASDLERLNYIQKSLLTDEQKAKLHASIAEREKRIKAINERQSLSGSISAKASAINTAKDSRAKIVAKLETARQQLPPLEKSVEEARTFAQFTVLMNRLQEQRKAYAFIEAELENEPERPEIERDEYFSEQIGEWQTELAEVTKHLKVIAMGSTICPTCGTQLDYNDDDPKKLAEELAVRKDTISKTTQDMQNVENCWVSYHIRREHYDSRLPELTRRLEEINETIVSLNVQRKQQFPVDPTPHDAGAEERFKRLVQQYKDAIANGEQQIQKMDVQIATAEGTLKQMEEQAKQIADQLAALPPLNDSDLREAEKMLQLQEDLVKDKHAMEVEAAARETKLSLLEDSIAKTVQQINGLKKQARWAKVMDRVAIESRPVNFPKRAMQGTLDKMADPISSVCLHLGLPFRVATGDSLEFVAIHPDGFEESARCLSGGQKACVAVAFSLAKLIRCNDGLDVLFMDEPSAALDEDAVAQLGMFLQALGRRLVSTGKQVVISTHYRQLKDVGQYSCSFSS